MVLAGMCWAAALASLTAMGDIPNPYAALAVRCASNPYRAAYEHLRFANPYRSETTWRVRANSTQPPRIVENPYRSEGSGAAATPSAWPSTENVPPNPYRF